MTEGKTNEQLINTEKLAALGRMAAGIAHELNSPLTGIITYATMMLDRIPEDRQEDREDLQVIIEQAERCSRIIKGILGFSRQQAFDRTPTNINALISKTISIIKNQTRFQNITINMHFDETLPDITIDPHQIQQVLINLLINAADAMQEQGTIDIKTYQSEGFVCLNVKDSGPGIPKEIADKIFEPFFTTKPKDKGTGLGLSVSTDIVRNHGGTITLDSKPGQSASFTIKLPLQSN